MTAHKLACTHKCMSPPSKFLPELSKAKLVAIVGEIFKITKTKLKLKKT